jgi:hypothetical protein
MALANNQRFQLMKRFKRDLQIVGPEYFQSDDALANGDPALKLALSSGGPVVAYVAITRKTFNGFQVVAELSSSAAEGLPEHDMWLAIDNTAIDVLKMAKLSSFAHRIGAASLKIVSAGAPPTSASIAESNVSLELPNDPRIGASGA